MMYTNDPNVFMDICDHSIFVSSPYHPMLAEMTGQFFCMWSPERMKYLIEDYVAVCNMYRYIFGTDGSNPKEKFVNIRAKNETGNMSPYIGNYYFCDTLPIMRTDTEGLCRYAKLLKGEIKTEGMATFITPGAELLLTGIQIGMAEKMRERSMHWELRYKSENSI